MTPNGIRNRLRELEDDVDRTEYATALFYVRCDEKHFRACAAKVRESGRQP